MQIAGSLLVKNICCEVVYIPNKMEESLVNSPLQPDTLGGVQICFLKWFLINYKYTWLFPNSQFCHLKKKKRKQIETLGTDRYAVCI